MVQLSDKNLKFIKVAFHVIFISLIVFNLLRRVFLSIPHDWLFFLTSNAVENFIGAVIAYGLYFFVFKLVNVWRKIFLTVLSLAVLLSLALLKDYRIHAAIEFSQSFEYFTSFLGIGLLFYLGIYFVNRLSFFNRYKKMEIELNEAKEQILRNKLHPHFLFNAFNSLYSLSLHNHPDTSVYILKLSSMMRYLTDETHYNTVPLKNELDFIEQYIAIEKIRFGKDARINFTITDLSKEEIFIAPFFLITLIENAFKHGFYTNSKEAFVNIALHIAGKEFLFTVENSLLKKQHFQSSSREGKGLENLRQRLQLLYPKCSSLKIDNKAGMYTTQLKISLP